MSSQPLGPFKLVTVNNAPERAHRLVGRVVEAVQDRYTIIHAGNADDIESVEAVVKEKKPDILFTASMWTPEQSKQAQDTAKSIVPGLKTLALPQGLQVNRGADAVVEYIIENLPSLLEEPRA